MTSADTVISQFIEDWNAGRRPVVEDYLARVEQGERDDLAEQISMWLEFAPTPTYDDAALRAIAGEPALTSALAAARELEAPIAERVATLRERAGLTIAQVAERLVQRTQAGTEDRAEGYLRRLETGGLDQRGLSRRLLDSLAAIFHVDAERLIGFTGVAPAGVAFYRAEPGSEHWVAQQIDALSAAALTPAPQSMDELDRLFLGGPEA